MQGLGDKCVYVCACTLSRVQLCDPMDCSLPGSSVHGIFQVRILEQVPFPSPGDLPDPGIELESLMSPSLVGRFFTTSSTWEAQQNLNKQTLLGSSLSTHLVHTTVIYGGSLFPGQVLYLHVLSDKGKGQASFSLSLLGLGCFLL